MLLQVFKRHECVHACHLVRTVSGRNISYAAQSRAISRSEGGRQLFVPLPTGHKSMCLIHHHGCAPHMQLSDQVQMLSGSCVQ